MEGNEKASKSHETRQKSHGKSDGRSRIVLAGLFAPTGLSCLENEP
jgi:hypothetical protein